MWFKIRKASSVLLLANSHRGDSGIHLLADQFEIKIFERILKFCKIILP
jgi:hypothetical protein